MKGGLTYILVHMLENLSQVITPSLRELILESLRGLWKKANETTNPIDNVAIITLAAICGFSQDDLEK